MCVRVINSQFPSCEHVVTRLSSSTMSTTYRWLSDAARSSRTWTGMYVLWSSTHTQPMRRSRRLGE